MVKKFFLYLIFIVVNLSAQEISVHAYTDAEEYLIGDSIVYHLDIKANNGIRIYSTSLEDSINNVDIFGINNKVLNNTEISYEVILSKYDSASIRIPSIEVRYLIGNDTTKLTNPLFLTKTFKNDSSIKITYSNPVSFKINSLRVNVQEEIKDIKSPKDLTSIDWISYITIVFVIILIAIVGYFLFNKYKKRKEDIKEIEVLPPHQIALNKLEELDKKELHFNGRFKEYFSELTEILRKYYEDIYFFPALEMTSYEIINELKDKNIIEQVITKSNKIFIISDLVKFAKRIPDLSDCELSYSYCLDIIEITKPVIKEEVNVQ